MARAPRHLGATRHGCYRIAASHATARHPSTGHLVSLRYPRAFSAHGASGPRDSPALTPKRHGQGGVPGDLSPVRPPLRAAADAGTRRPRRLLLGLRALPPACIAFAEGRDGGTRRRPGRRCGGPRDGLFALRHCRRRVRVERSGSRIGRWPRERRDPGASDAPSVPRATAPREPGPRVSRIRLAPVCGLRLTQSVRESTCRAGRRERHDRVLSLPCLTEPQRAQRRRRRRRPRRLPSRTPCLRARALHPQNAEGGQNDARRRPQPQGAAASENAGREGHATVNAAWPCVRGNQTARSPDGRKGHRARELGPHAQRVAAPRARQARCYLRGWDIGSARLSKPSHNAPRPRSTRGPHEAGHHAQRGPSVTCRGASGASLTLFRFCAKPEHNAPRPRPVGRAARTRSIRRGAGTPDEA